MVEEKTEGEDMRIYVCDRCGTKKNWQGGIVGSEFDHQGFETVKPEYRGNGIVDLCAKCMKKAEQELSRLRCMASQKVAGFRVEKVAT